MNILLSAYACEPYKGSEPSVGWNWLLETSKTSNKIWLLTRKNNKEVIEQYFNKEKKPENIAFVYYDLPDRLLFLKKIFGIYLYYLLWQIGAFFTAKKLHKKVKLTQVHHVTFATIRQPSFMGLLKIPFIYGPAGGGESPPYHLIKNFPLKAKIKEVLRIFANSCVKLDPLMHLTFFTSSKIVVTSRQTRNLVASFYHKKTEVKLAIAQTNITEFSVKSETEESEIKLLFIGRFEYWKGLHLCIKALYELNKIKGAKNVSLTIVGEGPFKKQLQHLAHTLGVEHLIAWHPWLKQKQLHKFYTSHDIFVFPSLHDSGGMVVLEALSASLPVICLDLGGPATIVNDASGYIVNSKLSEQEICLSISEAILSIKNKDNYSNYCINAKKRALDFTWQKLIAGLV